MKEEVESKPDAYAGPMIEFKDVNKWFGDFHVLVTHAGHGIGRRIGGQSCGCFRGRPGRRSRGSLAGVRRRATQQAETECYRYQTGESGIESCHEKLPLFELSVQAAVLSLSREIHRLTST